MSLVLEKGMGLGQGWKASKWELGTLRLLSRASVSFWDVRSMGEPSPPFIPGEKAALLRPGSGLPALLLAPPSLSQQLTSQEQMADATSPAPSCRLVPWPTDQGLFRPPWCPFGHRTLSSIPSL